MMDKLGTSLLCSGSSQRPELRQVAICTRTQNCISMNRFVVYVHYQNSIMQFKFDDTKSCQIFFFISVNNFTFCRIFLSLSFYFIHMNGYKYSIK
jgi:hypothetical protein